MLVGKEWQHTIMELYQLRTFVTVADTGNLTHAAERLFTSQPAISAHVKALEEELGVKLFKRTPKGMQLTDVGNVLQEQAKLVLQASYDLQLKAKILQGEVTGQVKVGLNTDADFLRLTALHHSLVTSHPQLKIQITHGISAELLQKLTRGSLDGTFYFGWDEPDGVDHLPLLESKIVIAGHSKWAEQLEVASVEQLIEFPWINPVPFCPYSNFVRQIFSDANNQPNWVTDAASENSMNVLLRAGAGLSLVRMDEVEPWLEEGIHVWSKQSFTLPLKFGYMRSRTKDPVVKALLKIIEEIFADK